jgi:hypothetical protein
MEHRSALMHTRSKRYLRRQRARVRAAAKKRAIQTNAAPEHRLALNVARSLKKFRRFLGNSRYPAPVEPITPENIEKKTEALGDRTAIFLASGALKISETHMG